VKFVSHIPFIGKFFVDMLLYHEKVNAKKGKTGDARNCVFNQKSIEGKFQKDSCRRGLRK